MCMLLVVCVIMFDFVLICVDSLFDFFIFIYLSMLIWFLLCLIEFVFEIGLLLKVVCCWLLSVGLLCCLFVL